MEKRFILFLILSLLVIQVSMWWMKQSMPEPQPQPAVPEQTEAQTQTTPAPEPSETRPPETLEPDTTRRAAGAPSPIPRKPARKIAFRTKVYDIRFSARGGVPVQWDIIHPRFVPPRDDHGQPVKDEPTTSPREALIDPAIEQAAQVPRPFETVLKELNQPYLNVFNKEIYQAEKINQSGMIGCRFTSPLTDSGLRMVKTYLFEPDGFTGHFQLELINTSDQKMAFQDGPLGLGLILGPGIGPPPEFTGPIGRWAKVAALLKSATGLDYEHLDEPGQSIRMDPPDIQWAAIQSMYFCTALIPEQPYPFIEAKALLHDDMPISIATDDQLQYYPTFEVYGAPFELDAGARRAFDYTFFFGPKQPGVLKNAGHELHRVLFYNSWDWMRALCLGLMALLSWFHGLLANWGAAIIAVTVLVRLITFPLVHRGMKSQAKAMAEQAKLKPLITKLNEKYKDDPQKKNQEIFKLYREHGINPFGALKGCGWMLIQIPIFIALYKLLYQSIDLRGASFLWVDDLSRPDRLVVLASPLPFIGNEFNLLPLITAGTQVLTSKFTQQPATDPQQQQMQKMMIYGMPVFILFITYHFPAGLMLYWLVSNFWQVLQQTYVNKTIHKPHRETTPAHPPAKS